MKTIQVDLPKGQYHYKVNIGSGNLKAQLADLLSHQPQNDLFIVTNTTIDQLYPNFIAEYIPSEMVAHKIVLPDGERYKNLESISLIYDALAREGANRKSILIAFGGGVIGDMTGFAAASFMRGIPFVQIPTTLLSQVDSSIGGKTGVNHEAGKNFIGAFKQPLETIIDVDFLETLPDREFTAGYAELVKHGFIHDAYLFQLLKRTSLSELREDQELLSNAIFRSCEVKARVVERDERESSQRAILNFGHTLGHFIETFTKYERYLHGEALIAGLAFAAWWSSHHGHLEVSDRDMIHDHLRTLGVTISIPAVTKEEFIQIIDHDKKADKEGIRFIGITSIGSARIFEKVISDSLWDDFCEFLTVGQDFLVVEA